MLVRLSSSLSPGLYFWRMRDIPNGPRQLSARQGTWFFQRIYHWKLDGFDISTLKMMYVLPKMSKSTFENIYSFLYEINNASNDFREGFIFSLKDAFGITIS